MSIRGWRSKWITSPRGMWTQVAQKKTGNPSRASDAKNVRVNPGVLESRPGTSRVFSSAVSVTGMYNWITPSEDNLVLYKGGDAIQRYRYANDTVVTLLAGLNGAVQPSFADIDVWMYFAAYNAMDNGTIQAHIYDGTNVDVAFRGPVVLISSSATATTGGLCSVGTHYYGFVYQNRTGYAGVPTTSITFPVTGTSTTAFLVSATSNANPDVLTVPAHTFTNGQMVIGTGATGDTAINGSFLVTNVAVNTLQLTTLDGTVVAGNGVYTGGGTLSSANIISAPGNNLVTGDKITIAGALGDTAINGTWTVIVVTPGNTFTLVDANGNPVPANGAYTGSGVLTVPLQITLTDPSRIDISVTLPALPDGGTDANGGVQSQLFLIMTPADNPAAWFFIPNVAATSQVGVQPVPFNTPVTLAFSANVSDEDMQANYDSALPNFLFLSRNPSGHGPFFVNGVEVFPNFVSVYGHRMVYGVGTIAYASDLNNPQQISADLNQITMPNQRKIAYAFQLPNSTDLYLTGERWTARVTDNNDSPSTWAQPISISKTLGARFPNCVCYSTGSNNAWIVTEAGIYYFDGTYADRPLTYLINDIWRGVNWEAAHLIEITDDVADLKLHVSIPYGGGQTTPNQILIFDYQNGKEYDRVDITIDFFTAKPTIGSVATVKDDLLQGRSNVWIGPSSAGNVVRYDTSTHNDEGVAIESFWVSGLFLGTGEMTSAMLRLGAANIWVRGVGTLGIEWRGPDNVQLVPSDLLTDQGVPSPLSPTPGLIYQTKLDFPHIENFTFGPGTNAVDAWFSLSGIRAYWKDDLYNR